MKTSNILMSLFLLFSLIGIIILSVRMVDKMEGFKEHVAMIKGNRSGMSLQTFSGAANLEVKGSDKLKVFLKCTENPESKVWIESSAKNLVSVALKNDSLLITAGNLKSETVIVVETGALKSLSIENSAVQVDRVMADSLGLNVKGNTYVVFKAGSVDRITLTGRENSMIKFEKGVNVKVWDISLFGNAIVNGISPNSKLNMSVKDNAKVNLLNSSEY